MVVKVDKARRRLDQIVDGNGVDLTNQHFLQKALKDAMRCGLIEKSSLAKVFGCEVRHVMKRLNSDKSSELTAVCRGLGFGTK